ncbi:MAG TPA: helix-turn-helix domain-containing GNAT family N-acetyltransferase [Gemmatimonadales bacterium]|nr:helix-turn-helix domain-containing GNAT family N-acetyltransferase [Gemmatimonadales bacterium]
MATPDPRIAAVRRFNRFYTSRIGVLGDHLYQSPFSLPEVRVMYEVAHRDQPTATVLARELSLDPGYLSRILRTLERQGLLTRTRSRADGRHIQLALTAKGRKVFAGLEAGSDREVAALLQPLDEPGRRRLVGALAAIEELLGAERTDRRPTLVIRQHQPGDLGWIVATHGVLYDREYGWDETFEALVAEIVGKFGKQHDPARERCWIAELDGENVGCVMCCRESDDVARLRLLLVDPKARGLGLGTKLVDQCLKFARRAGYRRMVLWTNDVLTAARRIYEKAGFTLTKEESHRSFGKDLVGQTWELRLVTGSTPS